MRHFVDDLLVERDADGHAVRAQVRKEAIVKAAALPQAIAVPIESDARHEHEVNVLRRDMTGRVEIGHYFPRRFENTPVIVHVEGEKGHVRFGTHEGKGDGGTLVEQE